jgi:hypothetical protein
MSKNDTRGRTAPVAGTTTRDGRSLRPNSFSVAVMLIVQYGLGIWLNLYAKIPASDHGKGVFAAFGAAVADGPAALALHALLGTLLLVAAMTLTVRAAVARMAATTVIGAVALVAIVAAWLSGARFTGDAADSASFGMAMATAVALLCYVIILFVPSLTQGRQR